MDRPVPRRLRGPSYRGLLAVWKSGVLASIGPVWTAIGVVIAIGLGIMLAVSNSGEKKTIEVDKS